MGRWVPESAGVLVGRSIVMLPLFCTKLNGLSNITSQYKMVKLIEAFLEVYLLPRGVPSRGKSRSRPLAYLLYKELNISIYIIF